MKKANLPIEDAHEPDEEARQPLPQNMNRIKKVEMRRNRNITFEENDKPDSQSSSSYKEALSQPAPDLNRRQRLVWLQKRRSTGLWVQCNGCNRWRYLPQILDKSELPQKWYCKMNPDANFASCSIPEVPLRPLDEEDLIYSEYSAGSIVLARVSGWPWWPAMVEDCPDTEQYYWLDGLSDIPTHYNVVFFDSCEVTRAWLPPSQIKPYIKAKKLLNISLKEQACKNRLEIAKAQADDAQNLTLEARLSKYSFISRYKGDINSPQKAAKNAVKKYQKLFKRKYNIELPSESDSEEDLIQDPGKVKRIILGSKKNHTNKSNDDENNSKVDESLVVEVGTNSELVKVTCSNDKSTKTAEADTTFETSIDIVENTERTSSRASEDFDF